MTILEVIYTSRVNQKDSEVYFDRIIERTRDLSLRQEQDPLNGDERHIFDNGGVIRYNHQTRTIELSDRVDGVVQFGIGRIINGNGNGGGVKEMPQRLAQNQIPIGTGNGQFKFLQRFSS